MKHRRAHKVKAGLLKLKNKLHSLAKRLLKKTR
jgi:hypothetical protein